MVVVVVVLDRPGAVFNWGSFFARNAVFKALVAPRLPHWRPPVALALEHGMIVVGMSVAGVDQLRG